MHGEKVTPPERPNTKNEAEAYRAGVLFALNTIIDYCNEIKYSLGYRVRPARIPKNGKEPTPFAIKKAGEMANVLHLEEELDALKYDYVEYNRFINIHAKEYNEMVDSYRSATLNFLDPDLTGTDLGKYMLRRWGGGDNGTN